MAVFSIVIIGVSSLTSCAGDKKSDDENVGIFGPKCPFWKSQYNFEYMEFANNPSVSGLSDFLIESEWLETPREKYLASKIKEACNEDASLESGQPEVIDVSTTLNRQIYLEVNHGIFREVPNYSTLDKPLPPGYHVDTEGWLRLVVEIVGKVPENVVTAYDTEFDSSLDYILVKIAGVNANGEPVSLYRTVGGCQLAGAVGSDGIVRNVIIGTPSSNERSGVKLITFDDDKVLDGEEISGQAIFSIERGDPSGVIMMQSKNCGVNLDLFVAIGDVSKLQMIQ
jgi:hypothetical protein